MSDTFIHTITLYNKYEDRSNGPTVTVWKKTVLNNCYFGAVSGKSLSDTTLSEQNSFVCRIPENNAFTEDYNGADNTFTLRPGDIIVKGDIAEEIADVKGIRASDLLSRYAGKSFVVKSVSINTVIPFDKHYRASGV